MIRTTADASRTNRDVLAMVISAIAIHPDQRFGRRIKALCEIPIGQRLKIGQGLTPPFTGIAPTNPLQISESLLAEAAIVALCSKLQQLMQSVGAVANLEGGHP